MIEELLDAFRERVHDVLREQLLAVYIFGSAVTGDLETASSDIDFLVVTDGPLTERSIQRLTELHRQLAAQYGWGSRLDGGYAAREQLRPWGLDGPIAAIKPGRPLQAGIEAEHGPGNMLAIREAGRALHGPPARTVVPAVDAQTLERGVRGYLDELLGADDEGGTVELALRALNIARSLYALERGRPSSLSGAAAWLARKQPQLEPVLTAALAARAGRADEQQVRLLRAGFSALRDDARRLSHG